MPVDLDGVVMAHGMNLVLIAEIAKLLILFLIHVTQILVKMAGFVLMENVFAPFTVEENIVKIAGDATLIHAKMEEPVTKVPVLVLQTLLDQNVNIKLTSVIQTHAMDKIVPMEYVLANLNALEKTAKIAKKTHVSQTHAKMEELAPMERVSAQLASREGSVKHMTLVSQTHAKMEELAPMERVSAQLASREGSVKHMTLVSQTHAKMEELAPMERVSAQLASRETSVKHPVKHPTLVSQTHAKMEELAKMEIVLANRAARERSVKNANHAL